MKIRTQHLLSGAFAALLCFCASAFAQSLALTYQLTAHEQRASSGSLRCPGATGSAGVGACGQPAALGRYSRQLQHEEDAVRAPAGRAAASPSRPDADGIPYLGETTRTPGVDARPAEPEFNLRVERPRVRDDIERRFRDAAQEARFNRNFVNALGLEVIVPLHSKPHQSADPALPEAAPF